MTREDAFEIWLPIIKMGVKSMPECSEALDMAINALKQEPCTDAISRQAAIYVINHAQVNFSVESEIDFTKHEREVHEIIENVLGVQEKALKELPPVNPAERVGHWIPVSERLPDNHGDYISSDSDGVVGVLYFIDGEWIYDIYDKHDIIDNVIAWMPLPTPYKASPTGAERSE